MSVDGLVPRLEAPTTAYELLDTVLAIAKEEPRRLRMEFWGATPASAMCYPEAPEQQPACGTVACLAGWIVTLTRSPEAPNMQHIDSHGWHRAEEAASNVLGLEVHEVEDLFSPTVYASEDCASGDCGHEDEDDCMAPCGTTEHVAAVEDRVRAFQRDNEKALRAKTVVPGESGW